MVELASVRSRIGEKMEDRYLFKGKIKAENTGHEELDWAIGNLVVEQSTGRHYIVDLSYFGDDTKIQDVLIEVEPSTICQCTGLRDKNGKLIWENDIVKDKNENLYKAFWQDNYYQFSWICIKSNSLPVGAKWDFYSIKSFEIEVIGNVFDNPDLLEVQE